MGLYLGIRVENEAGTEKCGGGGEEDGGSFRHDSSDFWVCI